MFVNVCESNFISLWKCCLYFYLSFWNARILFITFLSKNSQISQETIKIWAAKAVKVIKILDLLRNDDVSKIFVKFQ